MPHRRLKFMVIGAQKAGTTWLHANLSYHPQVVFPPLKELFYFNEIDAGIPTSLLGRKTNNHWLNVKWKLLLKEQVPQAARRGDLAQLGWFMRYLTIPRNLKPASLDKYDRLFPNVPGKISGDITPNYSILSEKTVEAIADYYPDCKIIFIMRNPVERSWSQTKMNLGKLKGRKVQNVSKDEIEQYILHDHSNEQLSDYQATINCWTKYYPKDQLYFGFYDALKKDPVAFYRDILTFLTLEDTYDAQELTRVVFKGAEMKLPLEYKRLLASKYHSQLTFLAQYFQDHSINYPQQWLTAARQLLAHSSSDNLR